MHRGTACRRTEKTAICMPRREALGGTDPAHSLLLDSVSPEVSEEKFLLLQQSEQINAVSY